MKYWRYVRADVTPLAYLVSWRLRVLYFVLQVHEVVKSGSVAVKSTLRIRKVSALQDPHKVMIYNALHGLSHKTSEADGH
jgi:hypothetical protein